jgi:proteasome lid subunit RPN8/RPN11
MAEVTSKPDESIDIRMLARQDLPNEAFPGGRNQGFRVYFSPDVHAALWKHGLQDTSVEICGVLVGSWQRDQAGPFVKIVESIRGEGAQTKFAEVTFTHQTWAKINSEMDTKFAQWSIVGWYHTHPDFGIFLSDRDRFIHEHFFSGPGQVAHVIDPIRGIEGVFAWRDGKPTICEHFWIGDRIQFGSPAGSEPPGDHGSSLAARHMATESTGAKTAPQRGTESSPPLAGLFPHPGRLLIYGCVFLTGWLLSSIFSAWGNQRFVESVLASNGLISTLRLGLSEELDLLRGDLAGMVRPIAAIRTGTGKAEASFAEFEARLEKAAVRTAAIKERYGYTATEERIMRQLLVDQLRRATRSPPSDLATPPGPSVSDLPSLSPSPVAPSAPTESGAPIPLDDGKSKPGPKESETARP